jgi:hypothetical protein
MSDMQTRVRKANKNASGSGTPAHGIVKRIEYTHDKPGIARVEIEHTTGKKEKGAGRGESRGLGVDFPPMSHVHVHEDEAKRLRLGQQAHLRINDGEYGGGTSDEFSQ